jgi:periplasmic divalent cation tolerance protein
VTGCCQVSTAVDEESAAVELAAILVTERLAACAQIFGPVQSVYRWEGAVRHAREWLIVAKTTDARLPELTARIRALHRYEVPEIVALPIAAGNPAYLRWIQRETTPATPETR